MKAGRFFQTVWISDPFLCLKSELYTSKLNSKFGFQTIFGFYYLECNCNWKRECLKKESKSYVYGYLKQVNPTDFKSSTKTIETTFSPEMIRQWNPNNNPDYPAGAVKIPLGINYAESSQEVGTAVDWIYKGVKTRPKLFYNLGNFNPFLATGTTVGLTGVTTNYFKMTKTDGSAPSGSLISPVISHTMPMGNPDSNKLTNDSICNLFQSEQESVNPNEAIVSYNTYTNNGMYNLFYENRIGNIFNK